MLSLFATVVAVTDDCWWCCCCACYCAATFFAVVAVVADVVAVVELNMSAIMRASFPFLYGRRFIPPLGVKRVAAATPKTLLLSLFMSPLLLFLQRTKIIAFNEAAVAEKF